MCACRSGPAVKYILKTRLVYYWMFNRGATFLTAQRIRAVRSDSLWLAWENIQVSEDVLRCLFPNIFSNNWRLLVNNKNKMSLWLMRTVRLGSACGFRGRVWIFFYLCLLVLQFKRLRVRGLIWVPAVRTYDKFPFFFKCHVSLSLMRLMHRSVNMTLADRAWPLDTGFCLK